MERKIKKSLLLGLASLNKKKEFGKRGQVGAGGQGQYVLGPGINFRVPPPDPKRENLLCGKKLSPVGFQKEARKVLVREGKKKLFPGLFKKKTFFVLVQRMRGNFNFFPRDYLGRRPLVKKKVKLKFQKKVAVALNNLSGWFFGWTVYLLILIKYLFFKSSTKKKEGKVDPKLFFA